MKVIIGVSGGCDSMALLDIMRKKQAEIIVCHVNYQYRHDTHIDYQIVYAYCKKYDIPFEYYEVDKSEYHQGNFQSVARKIRYDFYERIYHQYQADYLLLAHHQDDVLETIYYHLERNSKPSYLGIKEYTTIQNMHVYRPLLNVNKEYLRNYCQENHIEYHDDYTNFETHFSRDRIRNLILPNLTNDEKEELFLKAKTYNQIKEKNQPIIDKYLSIIKEKGYIDYREIEKTYLYDLLYQWITSYYGYGLSHQYIDEIIKQIESSKSPIHIDINVNVVFIKEYYTLSIHKKSEMEDYEYLIHPNEYINCPYFHLSINGHINEGIGIKETDWPLTIRNYREGDSILSHSGNKKISKVFRDNKIPYYLRRRWPIVLNSKGQILLVPLLVKRKDYLTTKPTLFVIK